MRLNLKPGDFVSKRPNVGDPHPQGVVQSKQPGGNVVVKWPSGLWWKHHNSELRKVA